MTAPASEASRSIGTLAGRRPWLLAGLAALLIALAIPFVAFVLVPLFVQKQVNEAFPAATVRPDGTPPATASAPLATAAPAGPVTLAQGPLQRLDPVHFGTGQVLIAELNGTRYLRFENVTIAAAPDMYVYLSDRNDGKPGNYIDLGRIKGTSGSFNYEIAASVDLSKVHSVVVWCRPFNITVTYAALN